MLGLQDHRTAGRAVRLHRAADIERDAFGALNADAAASLPAARAEQRARCKRHRFRGIHRDHAGATDDRVRRDRRRDGDAAGSCSERYAAAAINAVCSDARIWLDTHCLRGRNRNRAAFALRGVGFNDAADTCGALLRGDRDLAAARPGCGDDTRLVERDVLLRHQHNFAFFVEARAARAYRPAIADHAGVNAYVAALGQQLTDIDRLVGGRADFDAHVRRLRIDELHGLAGGENDLPARRSDDAAVFDVGRNQIDRAAGSIDRALIAEVAGAGRIGEAQPTGEKISVRQIER